MNFSVNYKRLAFWSLLLLLLLATPGAKAMTTTWAAFQPFENGYMLWREDSGEILVLVESTHQVYHFAETSYASLPENPVMSQAPLGLVKPIRGFGRVWGNYPGIRSLLGWGTQPEKGVTMTLETISTALGGVRITLPDALVLLVHANNTWQVAETPPTVDTTSMVHVFGSFQAFERGYMIYADGTIWVLPVGGQPFLFLSVDYGTLPENPVMAPAPPGLSRPILGFGKVWGHFPHVRSALGWATTSERGYTVQVGSTLEGTPAFVPGLWGTILSFPDGRWVVVTHTNWHFVTG